MHLQHVHLLLITVYFLGLSCRAYNNEHQHPGNVVAVFVSDCFIFISCRVLCALPVVVQDSASSSCYAPRLQCRQNDSSSCSSTLTVTYFTSSLIVPRLNRLRASKVWPPPPTRYRVHVGSCCRAFQVLVTFNSLT